MLSRSARTAAAMAAPAARQSWSRLKTVLVAVDPSAGSRLAFDHASQLVTADDKLLLYTCGPATRPEIANFMLNMEKSDDATKKAFFEKLKARSEELASGVKRIYDPLLKTLSCKHEWVIGDPEEGPRSGIVRECEERDVDLCVLGSHGDYGAVRRLVLGSTADAVAHGVHCDVLLVKPKA